MAIVDYSLNKLRMWANVAGTEVEVVQVGLRSYLNGIPEAVVLFAVGREVSSLIPSAAHGLVDQLTTLVPITIWATAEEDSNSGLTGGVWPDGPFIVFTGQIVGPIYRKSESGEAMLGVHCRHFLVGLEFSWVPNSTTHPLNAANFRMKAGIDLRGNDPNFIISTLASKVFTAANIQEDYWANSLQPWLISICEQKQVFDNEEIDQGNDDAINTLNLFEPFIEGDYRFGVPLSMDNFDILGTQPGIDALAADAANETLRSFLGATIWEKIVSDFGSRYLFGLVPMASRALIAPVIPGLYDTWTIVDPSEYESVALSGFLGRPIRGVVLYTGPNSQTGALGFQRGQALALDRVGGFFENTNMATGSLYFRDAPHWLANAVSQMCWAPNAAAPNGVKGNAFRGPQGQAPAFPAPGELVDMAETLWDEFAKALYIATVFQGRRGSVTGRVRFDIAPGSSVGLVLTEEKFVALSGAAIGEQILYGLVVGVSTVLNSESCKGYTALEFSHLRFEAEHEDENLTLKQHPLWSTPFLGAPAVEEFTAEPPPEPPIE